jgi:hypothetical protein
VAVFSAASGAACKVIQILARRAAGWDLKLEEVSGNPALNLAFSAALHSRSSPA